MYTRRSPSDRSKRDSGTMDGGRGGGPRIRGSFLADLEHWIRSVRVFEDWKASFPSLFQLYIVSKVVDESSHKIFKRTILFLAGISATIRAPMNRGKRSLVEISSNSCRVRGAIFRKRNKGGRPRNPVGKLVRSTNPPPTKNGKRVARPSKVNPSHIRDRLPLIIFS